MTSNGQSSSTIKDDESNGSKKNLVNTRKSERLVKHMPVSPVTNRKSVRLQKRSRPSPLKRSDRGKKHTTLSSSGSRKIDKASVGVSKSEDPKPAQGKMQKLNGRTFKALFKAQRSKKDAADRYGTNPPKRDEVVEETSADAEKMLVDCPREAPECGIDEECGDNTKLSKRKRDLIINGCKTHNDFETCTACSKRRRVDQVAHGQDFCSCSTLIAKVSQEPSTNEDMEQSESGAPTEFTEKCDGRIPLKEIPPEIQTEAIESRCLICKLGGKLMFCDGKDCKTSCHPSCLDLSIDDAPGVWYCFQCVNNKTQAGACSMSENVESIWNAREVEVSDAEGLWKDKQYFVKYRGLAHTHNQWIPESQLLLKAAELVQEYNRKREVVKWNEEWVLPQRLLKKRLLSSPKQKNDTAGGTSSSYSEWLVKWCGLNYESVTWESDNADCLSSAHGQKLIKEYENRQKKALDDPCSVYKGKNGSPDKLQKLPAGSPPGLDTNHLDTINKLREFRHRGQNAVVFDDQDRIMKILLYIKSLSDVCQPFLIVTTSSLLPVWEAEFLRVAPSVDVIVYDGSSDNRKSIRTLEFYGEGGRIILQVLLSSIEVVVEDLLFFQSMKWKVLILDECQQSSISSQFEQIKLLATDVKILLFSGPLKDNVAEYLNLLSLLDSCENLINIEAPKMESSENLFKLKERLSRYIAYDCKSSSSKFVEFWVPCMISNVQHEQYCATLLSNSIALCLYSKTDPVGALRDIVFSTRKSCDHPYIVDPSLKSLITKDVPPINFLDVDIKASGKLQLLEMMLSELKMRQLRVLILFQSVAGSGRDTFGLGDILDDFLREQFGVDSFERVDGGVISSKTRQTALNNFNKGSGRFVFLLENRACLPSIRLVSVDTIIIFGGDWNPANDIKALNKISIDSKFKEIKIFRLYSPFTVEERVLVLAKQGLALESKLQNISRATSNTLLMWGASCLLNRLDEIHSSSDVKVSSEQTLPSKVVDEILELLSENGKYDDVNNSFILKIQQRGGIYCSNLKLLGEQEVRLSDGEHAHTFWTNLLNGRNPAWKFLSQQTQRHRKKVQYFIDSPKKPESEAVEVGKKRKKVGGNCINPSLLNRGLEQDKAGGGASGIQGGNDGLDCLERSDAGAKKTLHNSNAFEESILPDARKNLHLLLKPDILKLCDILKLPDEVKIMVERFLEYVIANYQVYREEVNILQALLISLCWCAASLLKQKVDRRKSLSLAKHHLNFICNENEADTLYIALRKLKKPFMENLCESGFSIDNNEKFKGTLDERMPQSTPLDSQNVRTEHGEIRDQVSNTEIAQGDKLDKEDAQRKLKLIQRKCKKRITKLKQRQSEEIQEFNRDWEAKVEMFENKHRVESAIIREMYSHKPLRIDKLKALENDYTKKMEELKLQKEVSLEQLKAKHLDALSDERKKVDLWLNSATSSAIEVAGQDELPLFGSDIQKRVEYYQTSEHGSPNVSENDTTLSKHPDVFTDYTHIGKMVPGITSAIDPNQDIGWNSPNDIVSMTTNPNSNNDEVENLGSVNVYFDRSQQPNGLSGSINVDGSTGYTSQYHSENESPDRILVTGLGGMILPEPLESITEEVSGDANSLEPDNAAVEFNGQNDRLGGVSPDTPNVVENHSQSGEANSSVGLDSPSTEILKLPVNQPASSPTCNQVEIPDLQPVGAEEINHLDHEAPLLGHVANVEQLQPELPTDSVSGHSPTHLPLVSGSTLQTPNEHTPSQGAEAFCQLSENEIELSGQFYSLTGQSVERNPPMDDRERPLADKHPTNRPNDSQISQEMVDHTAVLTNQVLPHLEANVELHPPTDVLETHLHQNQPDFPAYSRLDHQPVNLNASFLNAEAVPQVVENTTELPSQAVYTRVNTDNQVPSRIPKLTSYCDPLQNEMEGIRKEIEQVIKVHEDVKVRLKSELEELIAQLHRKYEAKLKDAEADYLHKKKELDNNHKKVLMNKILADAFRSKCVEPSRHMAMQQVMHPGLMQHLHQLPLHTSTRSSPIVVTSDGQPSVASRLHPTSASSMARQPAASKQNTAPIMPPASRIHPINASSTAGQPEASQQNTDTILQHVSRLHAINASFMAGQPAASQQNTAPILRLQSRLHPVNASSMARQAAASQQNTAHILQAASRLNPISGAATAPQPAASQQNTARQHTTVLMQHEPGDNPVPVSTSTGKPVARQQNTVRQLQPSVRMSPISVSSGQPAVSQQSTPPPLQIVHQSAALFSSTSTRPPQINPMTPLIGNLRVGSENRARAPAPHLQAFRSGSSANITSTQRTMPSHLTPNSVPASSSHALHDPVSSAASPIPTNYSSPVYSRPLQSNTKDMLPPESIPSSASVSRHELLKDIHKQHIPQRLDDDPPLPDLGLKLDSIDLSVFDTGNGMAPGSTPTDVTTNVVRVPED